MNVLVVYNFFFFWKCLKLSVLFPVVIRDFTSDLQSAVQHFERWLGTGVKTHQYHKNKNISYFDFSSFMVKEM